jgi:hypothetical protein
MSIVFTTPGLIPLEAFTVFGANAKPNTNNPIGFFGTGLKYAIAVCLRMGQEVILYRGHKKYTFYVKQDKFRDREFGFVNMKTQTWLPAVLQFGRGGHTKLPFTTELGKTWELWQAFREFETNTRDENGTTELWKDDRYNNFERCGRIDEEHTFIVVNGERFADEYHDRNRTFLEGGDTVRQDEAIQIIDRPSKHIYYRGMRVMDLKEETEYTYNFLKHVDLTEDRTAKYPFMLESDICDYLMTRAPREVVERVVGNPRGHERTFSYAYVSASPGPTFLEFAKESPNVRAKELWNEVQPTIPTRVMLQVTVPKSEVTEEELFEITKAIEGIIGVVEVRNMTTGEVQHGPRSAEEVEAIRVPPVEPAVDGEGDDVPF